MARIETNVLDDDRMEPNLRSLRVVRQRVKSCTRCPLYKDAIQGVPGEGPSRGVELVMVGEQPGDAEDRAGHPFVGPAGEVLNRALDDAGIDRKDVFITNAVKHFKFVERGKARLHQKPKGSEIDACHIWLEAELRLLEPKLIVCLGATAAQSVFGRTMPVMKERGKILTDPHGRKTLITIHPSYVLRVRGESADRTRVYQGLVNDLKRARTAARG